MTLKRAKTQERVKNTNTISTQQLRCPCNSPLGLICALLSGLFGAASGLMVKLVQEADADQIQFLRNCLQYLVLVPLITYKKESIISDKWSTNFFLLARGAFGQISGLALVYSIRFLPLGDAISIIYVYVTLVGIFAFFFLKEPCGIFDILVTFATLCGLIFVTQPSFLFDTAEKHVNSGNRTVGVILALFAAVLTAWEYIFVRKMGSKVHYSLTMLYFAWEGLIFLPVYMAFRGTLKIPCLSDVFAILGYGVFAFISQMLMTIALQKERAGPASVVQTFEIIFAFLFQIFFTGSPISLFSGIGAFLIFMSSSLLVFRKMRKEDDHEE